MRKPVSGESQRPSAETSDERTESTVGIGRRGKGVPQRVAKGR